MPRFSYAEEPDGVVPSTYSVNADTGSVVSFLSVYLSLDVVYEIYNVFSAALVQCTKSSPSSSQVLPAFRNLYLYDVLSAGVDGCPVLLNNVFTLACRR